MVRRIPSEGTEVVSTTVLRTSLKEPTRRCRGSSALVAADLGGPQIAVPGLLALGVRGHPSRDTSAPMGAEDHHSACSVPEPRFPTRQTGPSWSRDRRVGP